MFDTEVYNSAYLLDEYVKFREYFGNLENITGFNKALPAAPNLSPEEIELSNNLLFDDMTNQVAATKVYYCDNFNLHKNLLAPFIAGRNILAATPPCLIMVCKDADSIFIEVERLEIINQSVIAKNHLMMKNAKGATKNIVDKSNKKELKRQIGNSGNKNVN
jgi:hypothetical protein